MFRLSHTQHTQPAEAPRDEFKASRLARRPPMTMIWVTESIGDRTRLVARWTTQD